MFPDPLFILRNHVIHNQPITFLDVNGAAVPNLADATHIQFTPSDDGQPALFKRDTPTAYKKSGSNDEFYPLDTLVFLAQNRGKVYGNLLKEGIAAGISPVSYLDIKHLTDFLTGVVETNENVVVDKLTQHQTKTATVKFAEDKPPERRHTPHYKSLEAIQADLPITQHTLEQEREIAPKYAFLNGNRNLSSVRTLVQQHFGKGVQPSSGPDRGYKSTHDHHTPKTHLSRDHSGSSSRPTSSALPVRRPPPSKRSNRIPLIVVPAAATSLLTMYNVREFLENHRFVPTQIMRERGIKKEPQLTIERSRIGNPKPILYHVVDSVDRFKPEDWDRLIAVITIGATWQFKKWKWENPQEIFKHAQGFYFKYADEEPKGAITTWNVETINIDRTKRHKDNAVVAQLWDTLDRYVAACKPHLSQ
ncbi:accessory factor associated with RNA polymerase II [Dispira simplex]|nr:accessory factor associated with RNA polymerase II [Dispira simplex]